MPRITPAVASAHSMVATCVWQGEGAGFGGRYGNRGLTGRFACFRGRKVWAGAGREAFGEKATKREAGEHRREADGEERKPAGNLRRWGSSWVSKMWAMWGDDVVKVVEPLK